MSESATLDTLRTGESGVVKGISSNSRFRRRLMEMGFTRDASVRVIKFAPLRDPAEYALNGHHIAIRREEAASVVMVKVEKDSPKPDASDA